LIYCRTSFIKMMSSWPLALETLIKSRTN